MVLGRVSLSPACEQPVVPYWRVYFICFDPMPWDFECAGGLPLAPLSGAPSVGVQAAPEKNHCKVQIRGRLHCALCCSIVS